MIHVTCVNVLLRLEFLYKVQARFSMDSIKIKNRGEKKTINYRANAAKLSGNIFHNNDCNYLFAALTTHRCVSLLHLFIFRRFSNTKNLRHHTLKLICIFFGSYHLNHILMHIHALLMH